MQLEEQPQQEAAQPAAQQEAAQPAAQLEEQLQQVVPAKRVRRAKLPAQAPPPNAVSATASKPMQQPAKLLEKLKLLAFRPRRSAGKLFAVA